MYLPTACALQYKTDFGTSWWQLSETLHYFIACAEGGRRGSGAPRSRAEARNPKGDVLH